MTLQPAAVVPPDSELWCTGYLRTFLTSRSEPYAGSVYVSNRKPTTNHARTVVVRRDGGLVSGLFDFPRLSIRVWTDDEKEGADLARLLVAAFKAAPGNGPCVAVTSLSGVTPIEDAGQFQKFLSVELRMRCSDLP